MPESLTAIKAAGTALATKINVVPRRNMATQTSISVMPS
jgi:hypothetical protein